MEINVTDEERELLVQIVEEYYFTLREEIYKTEGHEMKKKLKHDEELIESLMQKLGANS